METFKFSSAFNRPCGFVYAKKKKMFFPHFSQLTADL